MNFIRRLNRPYFTYQAIILKIGDLLGGWNLATNAKFLAQYLQNYVSTGTWGVNTTIELWAHQLPMVWKLFYHNVLSLDYIFC